MVNSSESPHPPLLHTISVPIIASTFNCYISLTGHLAQSNECTQLVTHTARSIDQNAVICTAWTHAQSQYMTHYCWLALGHKHNRIMVALGHNHNHSGMQSCTCSVMDITHRRIINTSDKYEWMCALLCAMTSIQLIYLIPKLTIRDPHYLLYMESTENSTWCHG